jgi:hypothetical protein
VIRIGEESGIIKPGDLSRSQLDTRLRELGLNAKRVYTRYEDKLVNEVHMLDFSVSEYFGVESHDGDDWKIVPLGKSAANPYKNKEGDASKMKLWLCSLVDSYSRLTYHMYVVSPGENMKMATEFLDSCYYRNDERLPVFCLPDRIELDQGSVGKSGDFREGMDRLGIDVVLKANKSDREAKHQSGGKVERRFRSYWQTEVFFAEILRRKEISQMHLHELNLLAYDECVELCEKKHPVRRRHTISQVYNQGLRSRALKYERGEIEVGNEYLNTSLFDVLYKQQYRTVDASGLISIDNIYYEIEDKRFIMEKIEVMTDNDGEMKGRFVDSGTGEEHLFGIHEFDADKAERKAHDPTLKERLSKMDVGVDMDEVSIRRSAQADQPDNVKSLKPAASDKSATTAFTTRTEKQLTFEEAQEMLCDSTNLTWSEIPDIIKNLLTKAYDSNELTKSTIEEFRKVVNQ